MPHWSSSYFGIPGLLSKIVIVSGLLLMVTSLLFYFLWLARSRNSVAEGGACASTGLYGRLFSLFTWFVVTVTVLCVLAVGHKADERKPQNEDRLKWENVHLNKF